MFQRIRQWHSFLLHRILGLPERDHARPFLRSHPPVPAHQRRHTHNHAPSFQAQFERELRRQPRIFPRWQHAIGAGVSRFVSESPSDSPVK